MSFTKFPELPTELQLLIVEHAIQDDFETACNLRRADNPKRDLVDAVNQIKNDSYLQELHIQRSQFKNEMRARRINNIKCTLSNIFKRSLAALVLLSAPITLPAACLIRIFAIISCIGLARIGSVFSYEGAETIEYRLLKKIRPVRKLPETIIQLSLYALGRDYIKLS